MSNLLTKERLGEIEKQLPPWRTQPRYAFAKELIGHVRELNVKFEYVLDNLIQMQQNDQLSTDPYKLKIIELITYLRKSNDND